jgi:hypothetical protein
MSAAAPAAEAEPRHGFYQKAEMRAHKQENDNLGMSYYSRPAEMRTYGEVESDSMESRTYPTALPSYSFPSYHQQQQQQQSRQFVSPITFKPFRQYGYQPVQMNVNPIQYYESYQQPAMKSYQEKTQDNSMESKQGYVHPMYHQQQQQQQQQQYQYFPFQQYSQNPVLKTESNMKKLYQPTTYQHYFQDSKVEGEKKDYYSKPLKTLNYYLEEETSQATDEHYIDDDEYSVHKATPYQYQQGEQHQYQEEKKEHAHGIPMMTYGYKPTQVEKQTQYYSSSPEQPTQYVFSPTPSKKKVVDKVPFYSLPQSQQYKQPPRTSYNAQQYNPFYEPFRQQVQQQQNRPFYPTYPVPIRFFKMPQTAAVAPVASTVQDSGIPNIPEVDQPAAEAF